MTPPSATDSPALSSPDGPGATDDLEEARSGGASAWFLLVIAVVGLGVSAYLTTLHYAAIPALCPGSGGIIDCQGVLTSSYSVVPGTSIPVTVPGMLWFLVSGWLAVLSLAAGRRGEDDPTWLRPLHLAWTVVGLAAALYFVFCELVKLHEICVWCTSVHLMVFVSLLVAAVRFQGGGAPVEDAPR